MISQATYTNGILIGMTLIMTVYSALPTIKKPAFIQNLVDEYSLYFLFGVIIGACIIAAVFMFITSSLPTS